MTHMGSVRAVCFAQLLAGLFLLRLAASADVSGQTDTTTGGTLLLVAELGSPVLNECDRHFASLECSASLAFAFTGNNKVQLVTDVAVSDADCKSTILVLDAIGAPQ